MAMAALREWKIEPPRPDPGRLDAITLMPNRRQFAADAVYWGHARATLVLVTLAEPQAFNEILRVLGHSRSDEFVRAGAARLVDILGPGTAIYHVDMLGFAFRLPGLVEPDRPAMIDRIIAGFRTPILCDDVPIDARIGIGLRAMGGTGGSPSEDLRAALSASEESRGRGKGWSWFDRKTDDAHRRAFRLLSDLKHALDAEGQLELHYQPKVMLNTGACPSAEALLRWTHPELGPISPGEFVELAEKTALVTPMTRWVIDAATRQAALWQRDGLDPAIAINVSPKNSRKLDFVEYLLFCCAATRGLDHARIGSSRSPRE
ncbi:MAG: EAL domain-containing protein [Amaricoccus sp.]